MTGISTLGQALSRINLLNDQNILLNSLSTQLTTGKKTQTFTGLNTEILASKRARASFDSLTAYTDNIKTGQRRINLMRQSIDEFKVQAENFSDTLVGFSQESVHQKGEIVYYDDPLTPDVEEQIRVGMNSAEADIDFQTIQDFASSIYDFLVELMNDKDIDRFLFSGADTQNKPIVDSGTLDSAISSLIGDWKDELSPNNISSAELINALQSRTTTEDPNAITDTTIGYTAELAAGNVGDVYVRVDEETEVKYTVRANEDPFRDAIVAAAFIKNADLSPIADVYAEPYTLGDPTIADGAPGATLEEMKDNFFEVFNAMTKMMNDALDDLDGIRFRLEGANVRINDFRDSHEQEQAVLQTSIDNIENADINEVAVKINALQVQLDASYRVTASLQQISLVNFI